MVRKRFMTVTSISHRKPRRAILGLRRLLAALVVSVMPAVASADSRSIEDLPWLTQSDLTQLRKSYPGESFPNALSTSLGEAFESFDETAAECELVCHQCAPAKVDPNRRDWQVLPDGLLYRSYLAAPHEPRISLLVYRDSREGKYWDATVGGRIGFLRYGTLDSRRPRGIQWDFEGAVMTRLDMRNSQDIESMDYRFGTLITVAEGDWQMKAGYFHISSHVGDEFLERNPTFRRVNYVTESWIIGGSYTPTEATRLYAEYAHAFVIAGGAKRVQLQTGAEYTPVAKYEKRGAPFAAINFDFRQVADYSPTTTVQIGWGFMGERSGRRIRFGLQYGNGPTSQFSFFERRDEYIGGGVWFDF